MNGKAVRQRKNEKSFLIFKKEKRDSCCGAISFFIKTNASFKDFVYNIFKEMLIKKSTGKRADKLNCVSLPKYFAKATQF